MASTGYPMGLVLHHQLQLNPSREIKDCLPLLSISGARRELLIGSEIQHVKPLPIEESWDSRNGLLKSNQNQSVEFDAKIRSLEMVDVQDNHGDSLIFNLGFDEQFKRHEKISEFLMSCPSEVNKYTLDTSNLRVLQMQALKTHWCQDSFASSLVFPSCEYGTQEPFMDFVGDLIQNSKITIHPDGQAFLTATGSEIKDILSIVAEFCLSKNSLNLKKQSSLVPYYERLNGGEVGRVRCSLVNAATIAPIKSPDTVKIKSSPKRRSRRKAVHERDLYNKNYFHACESLLSFMFNKKQDRKRAILSLKSSGPKLPGLLTRFSAGIAGTGLAILFSVMYNVACGRVAFSSSRLLNTGFGFGLVWVSCAVNKLRDAIMNVSKKAGKVVLKEDEMVRRVDKSINEIFFRAATLMTVAVLRIG